MRAPKIAIPSQMRRSPDVLTVAEVEAPVGDDVEDAGADDREGDAIRQMSMTTHGSAPRLVRRRLVMIAATTIPARMQRA
jgi:hypothetical protein